MPKKIINIKAYSESGEFLGSWTRLTNAANDMGVTPTSIAYGLYDRYDHFSAGKFWIPESATIEDAVNKHAELLKKKQSKKENKQIRIERKGNYLFIPSTLSGAECCARCALYYNDGGCMPCRKDEGHANGYWRYSKRFED